MFLGEMQPAVSRRLPAKQATNGFIKMAQQGRLDDHHAFCRLGHVTDLRVVLLEDLSGESVKIHVCKLTLLSNSFHPLLMSALPQSAACCAYPWLKLTRGSRL